MVAHRFNRSLAVIALTGSLIAGAAAADAALADADSADPANQRMQANQRAHTLPAVDPQALRDSIAGLPNAHVTSAQVRVSGPAGSWTGHSRVADVNGMGRVPSAGPFRIGSATKMFTATVALQLVAEHRLDLERSVQSYLPRLLPPAFPAVSVGQLLNHTSGLPMPPEDAGQEGLPWQLVRAAVALPMTFVPGTLQEYNGVNYLLAGLVIEEVSGQSFGQELTTRILEPLGLRDTYLPVPSDVSAPYAWADGGMVSTTADLARFQTALLRGRLLPPALLTEMLTVPDVGCHGPSGGCAQGADVGRARFSIGLERTELPDGLTLWGKSGGLPGYSTLVVSTPHAERTLAVSLTTTGNSDGSETAYLHRIVAAAFGVPVD